LAYWNDLSHLKLEKTDIERARFHAMMKYLLLTLCFSSFAGTHGFVPRAPIKHASPSTTARTRLNLSADELSPLIDGARKEAFFWFFGASGGAGIARSQFPRMYQNTQVIRGLAGVGPTEGGETVGISPLCGYPQDLSKADVDKVVNNPKTVEQIVDENPKPDNFLAAKGYLVYEAFVEGNPDCNPLAIRAIFDTFSQSTNVVEPNVAQQKLDSFKADPSGETFKNELLNSKLKGYAAIVTLLFLLGLADVFAFRDAAMGWFPDWPGLQNFPVGLWNPGVWTIPQYWI